MYDYISIHSVKFASFIKTDEIEKFFVLKLKCRKLCALIFTKELGKSSITIRGIHADPQGNYGYDSSDVLNEINLIEIDIPENIDISVETEIMKFAKKISKEFLWEIDLGDR